MGEDENGSEDTLRAILDAASSVDIDDGLEFDHDSIDVAPIAGQTEHGGVRATIVGYLGTARTRLQIDMGFGDVMTGGPVRRSYRTIFGDRSFSIRTYSDETVAVREDRSRRISRCHQQPLQRHFRSVRALGCRRAIRRESRQCCRKHIPEQADFFTRASGEPVGYSLDSGLVGDRMESLPT